MISIMLRLFNVNSSYKKVLVKQINETIENHKLLLEE